MNSETPVSSDFQREVRLGLVLYGGVSLAIYMSGATHELFRAVRGRGVYWLIKHLIDADIGVDVASGASAGGINGIFLSFALANEREFAACAQLWRRDGDLDTLLRALDATGDEVPSVLDSAHYLDVLESGFRTMWNTPLAPEQRPPEAVTPTRELDLFVTGTDFYGRLSNEVDATGRVIRVKQHRSVFLLKHRQRADAKRQLDPFADIYGKPEESDGAAGFLALAKLAQITSCFPGAFAPVKVEYPCEDADADRLVQAADARLSLWGSLSRGEHYFVDGGVLDNKPFTTTLDAIFHRPAERRVCRHLLYLEPDPERAGAASRREDGTKLVQPSFLSSVLDSVARLPSYESISEDLGRIAEHNATIQRFNALVKQLSLRSSVPVGTGRPSSSGLYLCARLLGIGQRVSEELGEQLAVEAPALARQQAAPGGAIATVEASGQAGARLGAEALQELLEKLSEAVRGMSPTATRDLLAQIDIDFAIRRLMSLTYELEPRSDGTGPYRWLWIRVNEEVQRLEIVHAAMERAVVPVILRRGVADGSLTPEALWGTIRDRIGFLLAHAGLESCLPGQVDWNDLSGADGERRSLKQELERRLAMLAQQDPEVAAGERSLLEVSSQRLGSLLDAAGCPDLDRSFLERFEDDDAVRYPLELASGVHERDVIHVVRLSPLDAQRGLSNRPLADKLCGETFGHFGAFLKKSWRSNDILWGRLDGISKLAELLLERTHFDPGSALPPLRGAKLWAALHAQAGGARAFLGRLFPDLERRIAQGGGADPLSELLQALARVAPEQPRLTSEEQRGLVERLIEVAQLDALCDGLPLVIQDAAEEQLGWRELKSAPEKRALRKLAAPLGASAAAAPAGAFWDRAWQFRTTGTFFDKSLLELATRELAREALARMSTHELEAFFRGEYAVGSETPALAMPRPVLLDLVVRGAALATRALESGAGDTGRKLRDNGAYRLVIRWPIRVIVELAGFLRASPHYIRAFVIGALLYAALALIANVLWFDALYDQQRDGITRAVALTAFTIVPACVLTVAWIVWRPGIWKRGFIGLLAVALGIALGFGLIHVPALLCRACEP
jgi:patatin-related protein